MIKELSELGKTLRGEKLKMNGFMMRLRKNQFLLELIIKPDGSFRSLEY